MNTNRMQWWINSDAGLAARLGIGAAIFAAFAGWDLLRYGREARRWREYAFLFAAALLAMAYGAVNDQVTSLISWEYFYYGKDLAATLGPRVPPATGPLLWEAAKIGMKAAGSAGILAGVALLMANNPRPGRAQLPYRRLFKLLVGVMGVAAGCGAILGIAGYAGRLTWMSKDLQMLVRDNLFRPRRFLCTYGIHLGNYVGGLLGTLWAVWRIRIERRFRSTSKHA